MRRGGVVVSVVAVLVSVAPVGAQATSRATPLRILVTNDDGVKAPGIDVVVEALRKVQGVEVTVVAPAANQSGASDHASPDPSSLVGSETTTLSGYAAIAVDGHPADSVVWALNGGIKQRPDLVVSGINSVENVGPAVPLSGTVGAARTAARRGIRALAVSQGNGEPPDYPASAARAVDWVEQHRKAIRASRGKPSGDLVTFDNLNVPTCTTGAVRGLVRVPIALTRPLAKPDCTSAATGFVDDVEAFANGYATLSERQSSTVCTRFRAAAGPAPTLADPVLNEVSGVAASRMHPPALWVHNDSGGEPAAYAISPAGKLLGAYTVEGATAVDWEDIAVGPGPKRGTSYLYLGDIGDNLSARNPIVVYRVPEPSAAPDGSGGTLAGTETFSLHYPEGPVDAESLFVDPRGGDLFIIDKEYTSGISKVFRAKKDQLVDRAEITLEQVGAFALSSDDDAVGAGMLPGTIVTGADVSPDGNVVLVRTYRRVLAFVRPEGKPLASAFTTDPCPAPQANEPQGEAVGFSADGTSYFTISEGEHAAINSFTMTK